MVQAPQVEAPKIQAPQVQPDSVTVEHAVERLAAPCLGRIADSVAVEHAVERLAAPRLGRIADSVAVAARQRPGFQLYIFVMYMVTDRCTPLL